MPKRIEVIKDWGGGQNDTTSSTKIEKNESVRLRKFVAKSNGVLGVGPMPETLAGDFAVTHTYRPRPGQGLGSYLVDYDLLSNTDTFQSSPSTTEVPTEIITLQDGANLRLWDGEHWHNSGIGVLNGQGTTDVDHELYGGNFLLDQYNVDGKLHVNNANFAQYAKSHTEEEGWGPPWGRMVWKFSIVSPSMSTGSVPMEINIWPELAEAEIGGVYDYHYIGKWGFTAWMENYLDSSGDGKHNVIKEIWEVTTRLDIGMTPAETSLKILEAFAKKIGESPNSKSYIFDLNLSTVGGANCLRLLAKDPQGLGHYLPFCVQMTNIIPIQKIQYYSSGVAQAVFFDYGGMDKEHDMSTDQHFNLTGLSFNPSTNSNTWEGRYKVDSIIDDDNITFKSTSANVGMGDQEDADGRPVAYAVPTSTKIEADDNLLDDAVNPRVIEGWVLSQEGSTASLDKDYYSGFMRFSVANVQSSEHAAGAQLGWTIPLEDATIYFLHVTGMVQNNTANCDVRIQLSNASIGSGGGFEDTAWLHTGGGDPWLIWDEGEDINPFIRSTNFRSEQTGNAYLTICHDNSTADDAFKFLVYKIYLIKSTFPASHGGAYLSYPDVGVNTGKVLCHSDDYPSPSIGYTNVGMRIQPHTMRSSLRYKKATYFSKNQIRTSAGDQVPGPFPVEIDEWLTTDETAPHSYDMHLLPPDPQHGVWFNQTHFGKANFAGLAQAYGAVTQWNSYMDVSYIFDTGMLGMFGLAIAGSSNFTAGRYYFGASYYDDYGQNTEITSTELDYHDLDAGDLLKVNCILRPFGMHATESEFNHYGYDKRVAGAKWWMRKEGDKRDWRLVVDIDFEKGFKFAGWDEYHDLIDYSGYDDYEMYNGVLATHAIVGGDSNIILTELPTISFEDDLQYLPTAQKRWRWKTSAIAGNRAYIGNVMPIPVHSDPLKNEFVSRINTIDHTDGHSDRILFSPLGKYDIFPADNFITVTTQDGDSIIALKGLGDEILQFKRNSMHIIEVTENDILTQEYKFLGIDSEAAVTTTMDGIAWCNESGVYYYDGNEVKNITEGKVLDKWQRVFNTSYELTPGTAEPLVDRYPSIEYCERGNILLAFPMGTDGRFDNNNIYKRNSGHLMIYEISRRIWYEFGESDTGTGVIFPNYISGFPSNSTFTNMINADAGSIIRTIDDTGEGTGTWRTFALDSLPTDGMGACLYESRDINFGESYMRKKIYRVVITLRSDEGWFEGAQDQNHTTLAADYFTSEGGHFEFDVVSGGSVVQDYYYDTKAVIGDFNGSAGEDATKWYQCILKPRTPSEANNITTFKLRISSLTIASGVSFEAYKVDKTFEINDISITYKLKGSH